MTPRQLDALIKRRRQAEEQQDRRAGLIAWSVACTIPRKKGSRPPKLADFLPRQPARRPNQAELGQKLTNAFAAFGIPVTPIEETSVR